MMKRRLSKTKVESKSDTNESESPSDFGLAKIVGIQQHSDLDSNSVTSLNNSSAVAEIGDHLATIDMGQK